jgi:HD-GYP domain-containing protein (c-di-GMP phosphodiesterase class II)
MNFGMYEVQEKVHAIHGPLNDKLMTMIRSHPGIGADRLEKLGINRSPWLTMVRQHHEHHDGSGYPASLAGESITLGARIIGLADRYSAMVSARGYRGPQKPNAALRELYVKHGQTIDVAVAGTLIRILGLYPVGTLVRLITGEVGVVTGVGETPDTPEVHAIVTKSGAMLDVASHRKTHLPKFAIEEVITLDKLTTPVRMLAIWGKDAAVR